MDFTREPIIETIVTPKEGYKLVVRNSKGTGLEEYFVEAVEVVSFGYSLFFRSIEKSKAFLVPVSDYEVIEVREARMVLKNVGHDRSIKIGGGRASSARPVREVEKSEPAVHVEEVASPEQESLLVEVPSTESRPDAKGEKKRDRRRNYRKRRGGREEKEEQKEDAESTEEASLAGSKEENSSALSSDSLKAGGTSASPLLSSLLQPPPTLISETIGRYREDAQFRSAFFLTEEEQYKPHGKVQELLNEEDEGMPPKLQEPAYDAVVESEMALNQEFSEDKSVESSDDEMEDHPSLPLYAEEDLFAEEGEPQPEEEAASTDGNEKSLF